MKRVSWNMFSKRRKVTIGSLVIAGKVQNYKTYLAYCEKFSIGEPLSIKEFQKEMPTATKPKQSRPKQTIKTETKPQTKKMTSSPAQDKKVFIPRESEALTRRVPKKKRVRKKSSEVSLDVVSSPSKEE